MCYIKYDEVLYTDNVFIYMMNKDITSMVYDKLTISLPKDTKKTLVKLSKREKRSQSNFIDWIINAYDEIAVCFYCTQRKQCENYDTLRKKLNGIEK